jgi:hypothetical protein
MKLTATEFAYVRTQALYIIDKCDACGKLLNQTIRYTISRKPEVYCSAGCRDLTFFGDSREAIKHSTPGRCVYCRAPLEGKKRGSIFCDDVCRKAHSRKIQRITTREVKKSRTPTQLNQQVATPKKGERGDCVTSGPQRPRNASGEVSEECGLSAELEPAIGGSGR